MRVTAQEKEETRRRILQAALELFRSRGFENTVTRDIAREAKIATGTLFNYFKSKEELVAALAEEALEKAPAAADGAGDADLEEELFALVAAELRQLRPLRKFIGGMLETALSPLIKSGANAGDTWQSRHLARISAIGCRRGIELSPVALYLYWTLYTGIIAFWSTDKSPKQEDTLALLDQSLAMFAGWLCAEHGESSHQR
jgi:AcrR family transcriptional regulator